LDWQEKSPLTTPHGIASHEDPFVLGQMLRKGIRFGTVTPHLLRQRPMMICSPAKVTTDTHVIRQPRKLQAIDDGNGNPDGEWIKAPELIQCWDAQLGSSDSSGFFLPAREDTSCSDLQA
jgi:hypothetical protein